ncbi:MAG: hypothetical protein CFH36_01890 [Alphaproteobacteria bacterium MarineAlpha9_Bin6]|nr:MAG: hypothetical protein CFH36_01890 [Alphaproteobacteria bacterium MarineAlpha9_Bin6]
MVSLSELVYLLRSKDFTVDLLPIWILNLHINTKEFEPLMAPPAQQLQCSSCRS